MSDCLYLASPKASCVFYQPRGLKRLSPTWCMWLVIVNED